MSALISVVKNANWIDLSPKHKELREYLENSVKNACIDGKPDKVIMVKGAFGIGKTNTLHYLFHYGWCKLKVPVLFVSLEKLYPILEKYAFQQSNKKIGNVDLCEFLDKKVESVLNALKSNVPNADSSLFFFDWSDKTLSEFCSGFNKLKLEQFINGKLEAEEFELLSPNLIDEVLSKGNRPLLLIDEFETKFTKLKSIIDASSGGELRELFDQVVENKVHFNLIIGNGPASGYELKNDKSNQGSDDAESSRITPKQVPFPLPETTKEFLGTSNKGLLNFAWWASRCRARHFLRLKEAVGDLEKLTSKNSYAEFLSDFTFFSDPIESSEDGESPITYVKTEYFNDFSEELKDTYLPRLITEIKPIEICFDENTSAAILKSKKYLFCSPSTINVSQKIMTALSSDINEGILKPLKEKGKFVELDYDLTLRKYFDFFLKSIAGEDGNIAFGMSDDLSADHSFCEMFLLPLMHLSYDFITQYEEESVLRNKQAAEFLLSLLTEIKTKSEIKDIRSLFPKTYPLFKKNDYLEGNGYIQLSLNAIRETFEQPIGEPKLTYKNKNLLSLLESYQIKPTTPILKHSVSDVELYFIPDLPKHLLSDYLNLLKKYCLDQLLKRNHEDGKQVVNFIYFNENNDLIDTFKRMILFDNGNLENPLPCYKLHKLDVKNINSFGLNFPHHTSDFLDSVLKIGLIGFHNGDFNYLSTYIKDGTIEISLIVNAIKQPDWTDRKETRRTIEHFEKIIVKNEKSELRSISGQALASYETRLLQIIPQKNNINRGLSKYYINDDLYKESTIEFGSFTKKIINLFLLENNDVPDGFLDLLKVAYEFNIGSKLSEKDLKLSFYEFKTFIQTKGDILKKHKETFSTEDSLIQSIKNLISIVIKKPLPKDISTYNNYLRYTEEHFISSYHKTLGNYSGIPITEAIYNLGYAASLNSETIKSELLQKIKIFKVNISNVRQEINQTNAKLQELLKLEELPFGYETKLGELVSKLVIGAEKQVGNNTSTSILITINEILSYFDAILSDAQTFSKQLLSLNSALQSKYAIVCSVQNSVNTIYSDSFITIILNNVKGIKRQDGDYYWASVILPTIKAIPRYTYIFKKKEEYLPNEKRVIDKNDVEIFISDFITKFDEKKIKIDSDKVQLDTQVTEIKKLLNLENQLKQLLKVTD